MSDEQDALGVADAFTAIDLCIEKRLNLPAITLIYTMIDVLGWLAADRDTGVRDGFVTFVDAYLLPGSGVQATALDLYAARCALVHTYTSESKLSQTGKARLIGYAWGNADERRLQESFDAMGRTDMVAVHVDHLRDALRAALAKVMAELRADQPRLQRVRERAAKRYGALSKDAVSAVLQVKRGRQGA